MKVLRSYEIRGVSLSVYDDCTSQTADRVAGELADDIYGLETIAFQRDHIVIDVGAHIGLASVYLAKRWPFLQIFAFEPHPANHANCVENLRLNEVSNVRLFRQAVTADGRSIMLRFVDCNSGGATAVFDIAGADAVGPVESVTLQDIFERTCTPTQRCRLLKIDCEGMEYEILPSSVLDRVDYFAAEFHEGVLYERSGYPTINVGQAHALGELCAEFFPPERMHVTCCHKHD
jgi:FkbM family methyltransferase